MLNSTTSSPASIPHLRTLILSTSVARFPISLSVSLLKDSMPTWTPRIPALLILAKSDGDVFRALISPHEINLSRFLITKSHNSSKCRGSPLISQSTKLSSRLPRSEEHTSELQSLRHLVCRLLL